MARVTRCNHNVSVHIYGVATRILWRPLLMEVSIISKNILTKIEKEHAQGRLFNIINILRGA